MSLIVVSTGSADSDAHQVAFRQHSPADLAVDGRFDFGKCLVQFSAFDFIGRRLDLSLERFRRRLGPLIFLNRGRIGRIVRLMRLSSLIAWLNFAWAMPSWPSARPVSASKGKGSSSNRSLPAFTISPSVKLTFMMCPRTRERISTDLEAAVQPLYSS